MYCQNCGIPRIPGARFCPKCGCLLPDLPTVSVPTVPAAPAESPMPAEYPQPFPPPQPDISIPSYPRMPEPGEPFPPPTLRKGRHRVPLVIMAAMVIIGLILFFATSGKPAGSVSPSVPGQTASETPWFRNEDGTLYFDASLYTGTTELTVPARVDGADVTCIAEDCFADGDTLTAVILPDTLEEIGSGAFAGCDALRGIFIPEGVKLIGSGAFRDCAALEAICVPGSVEAIGYNAFRGCKKLTYILYDGTFAEWSELYSGTITSGTLVYCTDGTYIHGFPAS